MAWVNRGLVTTGALAAAILVLFTRGWLPLSAGTNEAAAEHETSAPREIVLIARRMAFFVEGNGAPNPVLRVRAGERVRIVLRNEEPGVTHNFAVPGWDITTGELRGSGTTRVEFRVPRKGAQQGYQCTPHSAMMRGWIEIE